LVDEQDRHDNTPQRLLYISADVRQRNIKDCGTHEERVGHVSQTIASRWHTFGNVYCIG
jgi:hypothetical protein